MKHVDRITFCREYSKHFKQTLAPDVLVGLSRLIASLELDPVSLDVRWAAYMLATVKLECANTWRPITEFGKVSYFDKYNAHTELGKQLGNTLAGDGYRFRGRGFVQITGRGNYARLSKMLFNDLRLIEKPDLALEHNTAYEIMSRGMRTGAFTSRKLSDYISGDKCDYQNARKIINGLNRASDIAGYAHTLEHCLLASAIESSSV